MTPETLTRVPRPRPAVGQAARAIPFVLLGIVVVLVLSWLLRGPAFVDQVRIVNPTGFDVDVDVSGTDGRLLELRYVSVGETAVVRDVIDQEDVWTFHFSYGGTDAGTLRLDRARLVQDDWTVEIPDEVGDRLDAAGHEPSPSER
jgi:hypothetical protein